MDSSRRVDLYYESIKDLRKFILTRNFAKHQGTCRVCRVSYHTSNMLKCEGCNDWIVCTECSKKIVKYQCSK